VRRATSWRNLPLLGLLLISSSAYSLAAEGGEDLQVELVVDRPRPAADDVVQVTYVFRGTSSAGAIKIPPGLPLKNLTSVWGPATSTQIQFINGNIQRSVSLTWRLKPAGAGSAEIGETTWSVGDKTLKATPYLLEVGPPRRGPGQLSRGSEEDDPTAAGGPRPFGAAFPAPRAPQGARARQEPLVIYLASPDRTTAYVGEEIVLHYELITQVDISGMEYVDPPKFQGVWAEDLEKPDKPEARRDTYEGQQVTRFTLLKKAVAPLAPGTVTIPPATVRLAVRMAADPFVDPFSFMRPSFVERSTKPVTIKVLPIPGDPGFKGPVGRFDLHASVDRNRIPSGEAVTLKVKMSGSGNLRTAAEPPQLEIRGARVYPPTSKNSTTRTSGRPLAQAEWSYVIVPSAPGDFTVPPVGMKVFDPVEKRIVEKSTQPFHVFVEGSAPSPASAGRSPSSEGSAETIPAPDRPVVAGASTDSVPLSPATPTPTIDFQNRTVTIPLWALLGIPAAIAFCGGAWLFVRKRDRAGSGPEGALAPVSGEPKERAAARIERGLRSLLHRRWGIAENSATGPLLEALESAGVAAELREETRILLEEIEFLRFAPQLGEYDDRIALARERAARLFRRLA
jgi:hypothetical protein